MRGTALITTTACAMGPSSAMVTSISLPTEASSWGSARRTRSMVAMILAMAEQSVPPDKEEPFKVGEK